MEAPLCKGPLREQCVCNAIIVSRNDNFCCLEPSAQLRCNRLWFYGRFPACFSFLLALFILFISIILCFSVWRRIIVILLPPSVTWICWMWWDWERIIIMAFMPVSKCSSMLNYCGDLFHGSVEISSFDDFIRSALLVLTHIVSRRRRKLWAHRRRRFDPPPPPPRFDSSAGWSRVTALDRLRPTPISDRVRDEVEWFHWIHSTLLFYNI